MPDGDHAFDSRDVESLLRSMFSDTDFNSFSNEKQSGVQDFGVRVGSTCSIKTSQGQVTACLSSLEFQLMHIVPCQFYLSGCQVMVTSLSLFLARQVRQVDWID